MALAGDTKVWHGLSNYVLPVTAKVDKGNALLAHFYSSKRHLVLYTLLSGWSMALAIGSNEMRTQLQPKKTKERLY